MRTLKDQLSGFVNEFQNNWDSYLDTIAHIYRTTINDATGITPFEALYGRPCPNVDLEHLEECHPSLNEYCRNLRRSLLYCWESLSSRVTRNVTIMNRRPMKPLEYVPFNVGDYFMLKRIPRRFFITQREGKNVKLRQSLQMRYTGPFIVTKVINPVLFEATIHGKTKRVHALKMKHI